jgi:hypothetical protein
MIILPMLSLDMELLFFVVIRIGDNVSSGNLNKLESSYSIMRNVNDLEQIPGFEF